MKRDARDPTEAAVADEVTRLRLAAHRREGPLLLRAMVLAVLLHVIVLLINFPEFREAVVPQRQRQVLVVRRYIPPPPPIQEPRRSVAQRRLTRKIPLPDPTPDEPEPIREPDPEIPVEPLPMDVEILIGVPEVGEAPAPPGPLIAGAPGVTIPVRIEESYIKPEYPELARVGRLEGNVILQALINHDGLVEQIEVLRCSQPYVGFEEAACSAVREWRYVPATQGGRPVDVYMTVYVEFRLYQARNREEESGT